MAQSAFFIKLDLGREGAGCHMSRGFSVQASQFCPAKRVAPIFFSVKNSSNWRSKARFLSAKWAKLLRMGNGRMGKAHLIKGNYGTRGSHQSPQEGRRSPKVPPGLGAFRIQQQVTIFSPLCPTPRFPGFGQPSGEFFFSKT